MACIYVAFLSPPQTSSYFSYITRYFSCIHPQIFPLTSLTHSRSPTHSLTHPRLISHVFLPVEYLALNSFQLSLCCRFHSFTHFLSSSSSLSLSIYPSVIYLFLYSLVSSLSSPFLSLFIISSLPAFFFSLSKLSHFFASLTSSLTHSKTQFFPPFFQLSLISFSPSIIYSLHPLIPPFPLCAIPFPPYLPSTIHSHSHLSKTPCLHPWFTSFLPPQPNPGN